MKKIYLAGPDVFFPDALVRAQTLKDLCKEFGLEGKFPLDNELNLKNKNKTEIGVLIYEANIALIKDCDGLLANMNPFRGPSMDVGTAFEMGYAKALGKPVVGYTECSLFYNDRVSRDGLTIEDFGMLDNLMVHAATNTGIVDCQIYKFPKYAIQKLAELMRFGEEKVLAGFQECPSCAAKPGTPALCGNCLKRRTEFYKKKTNKL